MVALILRDGNRLAPRCEQGIGTVNDSRSSSSALMKEPRLSFKIRSGRRILVGSYRRGLRKCVPDGRFSQSVPGICCGSCPQAFFWLQEHLAWLARHNRGCRRTQLTDEPSRESPAARTVPGFIVLGTVSQAALPPVSRQAADR